MQKAIFGGLILIIAFVSTTYAREVPFTQEDRDRLIRLEEGQKSLQRQIDDLKVDINNVKVDINRQINNVRVDINRQIDDLKVDINRQIDSLRTFMLWGFGIIFGGMGILIGFVIWDRRTAIAPAIKKNRELEESEEKIERALKEMAIKDPNVAKALRHVGLL